MREQVKEQKPTIERYNNVSREEITRGAEMINNGMVSTNFFGVDTVGQEVKIMGECFVCGEYIYEGDEALAITNGYICEECIVKYKRVV